MYYEERPKEWTKEPKTNKSRINCMIVSLKLLKKSSAYLTLCTLVGLSTACGGGGADEPGNLESSPQPTATPTSEASPEPSPTVGIATPQPTPTTTPVAQPTTVPTPTPTPTIPSGPNPATLPYGSDQKQFGDLYRPSQYIGKLPVIIMIHGGCWSGGFTLSLQEGLSEALSQDGFAVWNIEYRSLGTGGEWPAMFLDVAAAADYLENIAEDYDLDLDRVITMGHSAGGHLALWLASRKNIRADSVLSQASPLPIGAVLTLGGITDLTDRVCGSSPREIIDRNALSDPQYAQRLGEASPEEMLPTAVPSILISGAADRIVPPGLSAGYVEKASNLGDLSEHLIIENSNHFDLIDADLITHNLIDDSLDRLLVRIAEE